MRKIYNRVLAVKNIINKVDHLTFKARLDIFATRCSLQKVAYTSMLSNDGSMVEHKNAIKHYCESKKKYKEEIKKKFC